MPLISVLFFVPKHCLKIIYVGVCVCVCDLERFREYQYQYCQILNSYSELVIGVQCCNLHMHKSSGTKNNCLNRIQILYSFFYCLECGQKPTWICICEGNFQKVNNINLFLDNNVLIDILNFPCIFYNWQLTSTVSARKSRKMLMLRPLMYLLPKLTQWLRNSCA